MKARALSLTLLSTLLLALLAACGGQSSAPAAQPTAAATQAPAAAAATEAPAAAAATEAPAATQAPAATEAPAATLVPSPTPIPLATIGSGATKIVWWHISTVENQRANWESLANQYVKDHPDVTIEITVLENEAFKAKLATAMQSGSPPDIFQSWGGGVLKQYADAGLIQDLTPALAEKGWGDSFNAGPLSLYAIGGKNYGVPWNAGMVGFWYNKDLFAKAGIAAPPATWAELLAAVGKLKAAGITPMAIGEKDKWPGAFWWEYLATRIGGQSAFESAFSRAGKFTDPAFVEAGAKLKELVDLQPFQTGSLGAGYGDQQVVMANGQAAMELMGQWAPGANRSVAENVDTYNASLGWFPFPMVEGGAGSPSDALGGGDGFAIGKNAPPAAIDFVRFLTSVENQTAMAKAGFAVPPVIKGAEAGIEDPLVQELTRTLANAKYYQLYYDQYMPPAVGATVNDATQEIFAGTSSPEQVAQTIEDSAAFELKP
jgi:raffinose/stachyose/melibiose transport system substrate-binding protein